MGKSSDEKVNLARQLLQLGVPYREIQATLKSKFGSGMSNTTLKKMQEKMEEAKSLREQLDRCQEERNLYKKLYFELLEAVKKKL
ncbi:hypothetical protein NEF87_002990 [Candidatus Lokiarchaeum ossiferum]|uniref:Transposase n=1 Tax=Candidatus Lokiarchaeum ossiferum TaxID=2951803 RepID=A0ABY6HT68_9ARCH|nr:hypothetical protein NEF87_002990 [Candidatus Lokiarchaeum sp. B-35]